MSAGAILVTGPTGNVGREVVRALLARGCSVRAGMRSVAEGGARSANVQSVELDFARPETFGPAVRGCEGLFLLRPPAISDVGPTLNALADTAAAAGVRRVAFLSVTGAEKNVLVPHHKVEAHLRAGGMAWTFLRAGFFAQNLGDAYRRDVLERDELAVPSGDGRVAWVDTRDLGDVAAMALTSDALANRAVTLTGPEALDFNEVAALLSKELGRPIRYRPSSIAGYTRRLRSRGMPWMQVLVQTALHTVIRLGRDSAVDPTLEKLLGRRPRTIAEYIHDHRALWMP